MSRLKSRGSAYQKPSQKACSAAQAQEASMLGEESTDGEENDDCVTLLKTSFSHCKVSSHGVKRILDHVIDITEYSVVHRINLDTT
jgi:hypothetical protein